MYSIPKRDTGDGFFRVMGLLAVAGCLVLYRPYILMEGWGWHIVPLGLPSLGYWQAWAAVVLAEIIYARDDNVAKGDDSAAALATSGVVSLTMSHLILWILV